MKEPYYVYSTTVRFNGAASRRTRKYVESRMDNEIIWELQWGRVTKDAEIYRIRQQTGESSTASMGPRHEGRGNHWLRVSMPNSHLLQWGRVTKDAEIWKVGRVPGHCILLQWDRVTKDAEINSFENLLDSSK